MELSEKNAQTTQGVIQDYSNHDLEELCLGSALRPIQGYNEILLGEGSIRARIAIDNTTQSVMEIQILHGENVLYTVSSIGQHDPERVIDAVVDSLKANTLEPLQSYFTSNDEQLSRLTFRDFVKDEEQKQEKLIQGAQYRDVEVGSLEDFTERLNSLPFKHADRVVDWSANQRRLGEQDVPVHKVVGTSSSGDDSWAIDNTPLQNYLYNMAGAMHEGFMDPYIPGQEIELFKVGEEYFVGRNGRHRVAATKALDSANELTVRARVTEIELD